MQATDDRSANDHLDQWEALLFRNTGIKCVKVINVYFIYKFVSSI